MITRRAIFVLTGVLAVATAVTGYVYQRMDHDSLEPDIRWSAFSQTSTATVDYTEWQLLLDDYLLSSTDSGVHLFDYGGLLDDGRETLDQTVDYLLSIDPLSLNRQEQKVFWINLYNILTVRLILDHFPTASITELGGNPLTFGPWDEAAASVNGIVLSLNDIEHRIIRPLYNDYRIHFGVNCASIGCPNLFPEVFLANTLDEQLDRAAAEYLNHPRGVRLEGQQLFLSSLFDWYAEDFGDSQSEILTTLGRHMSPQKRAALKEYKGSPVYAYDWGLNGYCSLDGTCGTAADE